MEIMTFNTRWRLFAIISPYTYTQRHSSEGWLFSSEKTWKVMKSVRTTKKQVPLKSYSPKLRIDSVNQISRNKEKVT